MYDKVKLFDYSSKIAVEKILLKLQLLRLSNKEINKRLTIPRDFFYFFLVLFHFQIAYK
jgi:hypothetical protein